MSTELRVSTRATSHGYGRDKFKWCSGLTAEERAAVKRGEVVVYMDDALSGGTYGTYLRQATYRGGRYNRCVPSDEVIAEYERITGKYTRHIPKAIRRMEQAGR